MDDNFLQNNLRDERGSVLLYAMLVISMILATTLVVSNFIRSSISITKISNESLSAFYAAESGAEETLYKIRKKDSVGINTSKTGSILYTTMIDNQGVKEVSLNLPKDESIQFVLGVPEQTTGAGIESVGFTKDITGAWLEVTRVEWNSGATFVWSDFPAIGVQKSLFANSPATDNSFAANKNYVMRVKALYAPANNLKIKLYGADNLAGAPLSFPNMLKIVSTGSYGDASVPVTVNMNRYAPVQGLFDYVLFSEEKIVK